MPTSGGCEVHAFTTSDDKRAEAQKLGAHYVHNTKQSDSLKKLAGSLDLIISTINVPLDVPGLLGALAPKGRLHVVGAVLKPLEVSAPSLIEGQKSVSGSPTGSPTALDQMLAFCARHSIAPVTEMFPIRGERGVRAFALGESPLSHRLGQRPGLIRNAWCAAMLARRRLTHDTNRGQGDLHH